MTGKPKKRKRKSAQQTLAAVDLGSNSFHMVVARVVKGQLRVVDRLREPVRLAMGLDGRHRLDAGARARAFSALRRFGERIEHLPRGSVRAVGTNTLRKAGTRPFMELAQAALGHPIEVISGQEEARLIYQGVIHDVQPSAASRLVVDIGGGSTEIILGKGATIRKSDSLHMGCVSYTRRFFPKRRITPKTFERALTGAQLQLEPIKRTLRRSTWNQAMGASGTIRAVSRYIERRGLAAGAIDAASLQALRDELIEARDFAAFDPQLVSPARAAVFAGGLAILTAIFEDLRIERMEAVNGALRDGVLYDLIGRIRHQDMRDSTIRSFMKRYAVDRAQARRIENTALDLLEQVFADWSLEGAWSKRALSWAARLHAIGMTVAYSGYHKHGAYLIAHTNMPGFSREDQILLAALVMSHRRRLRPQPFTALPKERRRAARRLAILLRLAVRLHRSRSPSRLPPIVASARGDRIRLRMPAGWLDAHPLTAADLEVERKRLARAKVELTYE